MKTSYVAKRLEISRQALYLKEKGIIKVSATELRNLCDLYNIQNIKDIKM